jgi:hypothetical protein
MKIGFLGLLTVAFIVLKLCKVVDWSWWWVLSPTWVAVAMGVIFLPFYLWAKYKEAKEEIERKQSGKSKWQERMEAMQEANRLKSIKP